MRPMRKKIARAGGRPLRTWGSQIQAWSAGRMKSSAKGFVAKMSNDDNAECEQRRGLAGEPLVRADASPGDESLACDEPGCERQRSKEAQGEHRPVARCRRRRVRRSGRSARPGAEGREEVEGEAEEEPEGQPCPQAAGRGQERDPAPPAMGEEVDRHDERGQEQGEEQQFDRPAADDAIAHPDEARRSLPEVEAPVERAEELLRGATERREPAGAQA